MTLALGTRLASSGSGGNVTPADLPIVRTIQDLSPLRGGGVRGMLEVTITGTAHETRRIGLPGPTPGSAAPAEPGTIAPGPASLEAIGEGPADDEPPWPDETRAEVQRILAAALVTMAEQGRLPHQRKR